MNKVQLAYYILFVLFTISLLTGILSTYSVSNNKALLVFIAFMSAMPVLLYGGLTFLTKDYQKCAE